MAFVVLPTILDQEGTAFYRGTNAWKPKNLVPDVYRRTALKDIQERLVHLEAGEMELRVLDRGPMYIGALKRMRHAVRQAQFAWRVDDLKFLQSISEFYSDFGTVLRNLQIDKARGRFDEPSAVGV